jgi:hypothetical protein
MYQEGVFLGEPSDHRDELDLSLPSFHCHSYFCSQMSFLPLNPSPINNLKEMILKPDAKQILQKIEKQFTSS